jgi:flagellar biosynthesis/type III secretory pathway chaperone
MDNLNHLLRKLEKILALEKSESRETLSAYIVGELICDYDDRYKKLIKQNIHVAKIADLAADLEWSNGNEKQLSEMWNELKRLVIHLRKVTQDNKKSK